MAARVGDGELAVRWWTLRDDYLDRIGLLVKEN